VAAGGDASMNTLLNRQAWYSSPQIFLMSPDYSASTELFRFANNPTDDGWVGGAWASIEWVQPPGTTDWEDGFVVLTECVGGDSSTPPTSLSLVFFDSVELAAIGAGSRPNPADSLTPAQLTRVDILPVMSPGVTGGGGIIGLSYDPATGNLYGLENTATGPGPGVVHVWNFPEVPEPATCSLLLLGVIPLLRRRARRR